MSRRYSTVYRLLYLLIAVMVCLFAFAGTIYTAMTQEITAQPLPRMAALGVETPTITPTLTLEPTATIALTATPVAIVNQAATPTPTLVATSTSTPEAATVMQTPTVLPTESATPTESVVPTPTPSPTESATPTESVVPTPTVLPTESATPTESVASTPTPSPTENATLTSTPVFSGTEVVTVTAETATPYVTATPSFELTATATISAYIEISPTVTITATPIFTSTPSGRIIVHMYAMATPIAPAQAPTLIPSANDPHVSYNTATSSCAACHRTHTAPGSTLRAAALEENVCFACHTAAGASNPFAGTNIQPAFVNNTNTATRFFKHDVAATSGVHQALESSLDQFGAAKRHVECEDCHEPHKATRGSASPPFIQQVMNSVSGVDASWTGAGLPAGYTFMTQAEREYQVCFKCHSSFTYLPSYLPEGWNGAAYVANGLPKLTSSNSNQILDSRDMAREFNPNNASFHPVTAQGGNQNIPAGSWAAGSGMSSASMIYCSSCHNNPDSATQGLGPHGSSNLHILKGGANYSTVDAASLRTPSSQEICFQCHNAATYFTDGGPATNTNFRVGTGSNLHSKHVGAKSTCYSCHDSHGSEQFYLINFDLSVVTPSAGKDSQTAYMPTTNGGSCALSCHGKDHNPLSYSR